MIGTSPALDSLSSISPSFTTQSSDNNNLSDIAARVVAELQNDIANNQNDDIYDQFYVTQKEEQEEEDPEEEQEFEFAVVRTSPSVTADVTTPLRYPLFDRSLLLDDNHDHDDESMTSSVVVRRPLRMLFNEERETTTSCSSSESDDLEGVTPGTYCVWKPKDQSSSESPDLRKKSNSTGNTSKRWKTLKKLLSRSNSHDGSFSSRKNDVLSNSMDKKNGSEKVFKKVENTAKVAGADDEGEPAVMVSVSDDKKPSNRFKSYLSYKQTV